MRKYVISGKLDKDIYRRVQYHKIRLNLNYTDMVDLAIKHFLKYLDEEEKKEIKEYWRE